MTKTTNISFPFFPLAISVKDGNDQERKSFTLGCTALIAPWNFKSGENLHRKILPKCFRFNGQTLGFNPAQNHKVGVTLYSIIGRNTGMYWFILEISFERSHLRMLSVQRHKS